MNSSPSQQTIINYTWYEVDCLCKRLVDKLPKHKYTTIIGISRGGMVPAIILSHLMDVREVRMIRAQQYHNNHKVEDFNIIIGPDMLSILASPDTLVVDDIIDRGVTLKYIHSKYPTCIKAALLSKINPEGLATVAQEISSNTWAKFAWERE